MKGALKLIAVVGMMTNALAQVPDNLVVEGVPPFPAELRQEASRYMEFRAAVFNSWHPARREMLIATRFADSMQLHAIKTPGAARKQLTFLPEPVAGGKYRPRSGDCIVFSQDTGGGEFYQLYRYDLADGRITLLTDGKSRNMGGLWARGGGQLAFTSTKRNGKDNDIWLVNPLTPESAKLVSEVVGGGWSVQDWSHDETKLLLREYISVNESHLHVLDLKARERRLITPEGERNVAYDRAQFSSDDKTVFTTTDREAEFQRLVEMDLSGKIVRVLTGRLSWDVEEFELSPTGEMIAFVTNEDGAGVLHLINAASGQAMKTPKLPLGIPSGIEWHENGRDLGFSFVSAKSPTDAYSIDVQTGQLARWTESETGGVDAQQFVEPTLVKLKSFDGLQISAFVYRPDATKFPGKRPVMVIIHGGPESQSRPIFQARNNYYLNELGIAIIYPNVRGSSGYGKTFVALDNGFKREDSVRDIAAVIDFIKRDASHVHDPIRRPTALRSGRRRHLELPHVPKEHAGLSP